MHNIVTITFYYSVHFKPIGLNICTYTGSHTVIHPCAKILAETGPIVIGENNLIEENVTIINKYVY